MTTTNLPKLRLALEIAQRSIALAEAQLPPPIPPDNGGDHVTVRPGEDLQSVIDAAQPGDVIELLPEERYVTGMLFLPDKRGGRPVTLRTQGPLPERRVQPGDALAILASGNPDRTIDGTGAANWILDGLQFESSTSGHSDVIRFQDAEHVRLSRILLVAGSLGQKRGICGNGCHITLARSHIANIWADGQDSQCFCAWDGAGPYTLLHNYLEGAGENVMFGGSDCLDAAKMPTQIRIIGNVFTKNPAWRDDHGKTVKNLLEFKKARQVHISDNSFEQCWTDAQDGWAIVIKSVNQDGRDPWACTEDLVFEDNVLSNIEKGIKLQGYDYEHCSGQTTRITIRRNTITCSSTAFQANAEVGELVIDANQVEQGGNLLTLDLGNVWPDGEALRAAAVAIERLTFTNNHASDVPYGIKGSDAGSGEDSLEKFCAEYVYEGNTP